MLRNKLLTIVFLGYQGIAIGDPLQADVPSPGRLRDEVRLSCTYRFWARPGGRAVSVRIENPDVTSVVITISIASQGRSSGVLRRVESRQLRGNERLDVPLPVLEADESLQVDAPGHVIIWFDSHRLAGIPAGSVVVDVVDPNRIAAVDFSEEDRRIVQIGEENSNISVSRSNSLALALNAPRAQVAEVGFVVVVTKR
jgi:hypothetical protein